jgi:hypothetical protein
MRAPGFDARGSLDPVCRLVDSAGLYTDLSRQIRFGRTPILPSQRADVECFVRRDLSLIPARVAEASAAATNPNDCSEDRAPLPIVSARIGSAA